MCRILIVALLTFTFLTPFYALTEKKGEVFSSALFL